MKSVIAIIVILAVLCSLFGCATHTGSKVKPDTQVSDKGDSENDKDASVKNGITKTGALLAGLILQLAITVPLWVCYVPW